MHRLGMAVQTPGGWPKGAAEVAASQGASTAVLTKTPSAGPPSAPPPGAGHTAGAASADGVASCQPRGHSWLWTLSGDTEAPPWDPASTAAPGPSAWRHLSFVSWNIFTKSKAGKLALISTFFPFKAIVQPIVSARSFKSQF